MSIQDLTPSTPSASRLSYWAGATFVCVMLGGLWQMAATLTQTEPLEFPRSWLDFRQGRTTGALEKQLDQKMPLRPTLIAGANSVRYFVTGSGGEQVRVGQRDWLFLTDELRYDAGGDANLKQRVALLSLASQKLQQQGVSLVIALVPDKARVYAQHLTTGHYPAYNQARYSDALLGFQKAGVVAVDLLTPLRQAAMTTEVYYRTDTHWNQAGAQVAAQALASRMAQLNLGLDTTSFSSVNQSVAAERAGDLIRLMGLDHMPNTLRPRPDQEAPAQTTQTSQDKAVGLFGDSSVPVVLVGTSYSLRGNFHGYLQQAMSSKVLNAAKDGGGFLQASTAYLRDDAFKSAPPKLLIWELPERFLQSKLDDEPQWLQKVGLQP
jgi:alginate O-acetyltransferase complex protein AlgJ